MENLGIATQINHVIFGYDYGCDEENCSYTFKSLTSEASKTLTEDFKKYLD